MPIGLLGKKIGMTQVFRETGEVVPVTLIQAGPCYVLQVKTSKDNGYDAIQLGFDAKREKSTTKSLAGHFKKANVKPQRFIREIRISSDEKYEVGQQIKADIFNPGDFLDITGTSIGKGFQGGVRRWHWHGGPETHGSTSHRRPGSIGSSTTPGRVWKGHHLPGRMGADKITVQGLEVIKVDKDNNILVIRGSVPGAENNYLLIRKALKRKSLPPGYVKLKPAKKKARQEIKKKEEAPKKEKAKK